MLVYADGTKIAEQKGVTCTYNVNLPDATSKDSNGWAEHINGLRTFDVQLDGLYSTTGLNAKDLGAYITSRTHLLLVIDGLGKPFVLEADAASLSVIGTQEETASISGSLKAQGAAYFLDGVYTQPITGWTATDYDTLIKSGIQIPCKHLQDLC